PRQVRNPARSRRVRPVRNRQAQQEDDAGRLRHEEAESPRRRLDPKMVSLGPGGYTDGFPLESTAALDQAVPARSAIEIDPIEARRESRRHREAERLARIDVCRAS